MSEEPALPETIDDIKIDAIISLNFSGEFYKRLRTVFHNYCTTKPQDEFKKALDEIKNKVVKKDTFAFDLETLLILIAQIEKNAEAQGKITKIPFPKIT